jgi:hypothetical protein
LKKKIQQTKKTASVNSKRNLGPLENQRPAHINVVFSKKFVVCPTRKLILAKSGNGGVKKSVVSHFARMEGDLIFHMRDSRVYTPL